VFPSALECYGFFFLFSFEIRRWDGSALPGFSEKRLVEAATKQLNTLPFYHNFWNRTSQPSLVCSLELLFVIHSLSYYQVLFSKRLQWTGEVEHFLVMRAL